MSIALIESHSVFVFLFFLPYPFIGPAPLPSLLLPPSHFSSTHCDEQPVKVKRKKSFNLSRKFPFYKSKENIVVDLVDSERKYQPCDPQRAAGGEEGRGETGLHPFSVHAFFTFSLSNFHLLASPPPPLGMIAASAIIPPHSHCPREKKLWRQSRVCACVCV